jgi:hypothetical protein
MKFKAYKTIALASTMIFTTMFNYSYAGLVTFDSGDLYVSANQSGSAIYDISSGGDFTNAVKFADGGGLHNRNLGQMTWSQDLSQMYTTNYSGGSIFSVNPDGTSQLYANVSSPVGIATTKDNRILVLSYPSTVYDITDANNITTFATIPGSSRNMKVLPSGEILVASSNGTVFDIQNGTAVQYAKINGISSSYLGDIDYDNQGNLFVTGGFGSAHNIFDITGGGIFDTSDIFATIINPSNSGSAFGLAINQITNQMLLAPLSTNYILDITAGGNIDASLQVNKFAYNMPITTDMAIDFVPYIESQKVPEPSTLAIFALGVIGLTSRRFRKQS